MDNKKKISVIFFALIVLGAGLFSFMQLQKRARIADIISDEARWDLLDAAGAEDEFLFYDAQAMQANREAVRSGVKSPAFDKLIVDADSLLGVEPKSVVMKDVVPPSGDKHDYMSQGPYWWPDPEKPDGLPYIRRDGETNPEIKNLTDAGYMSRMAADVNKLGHAYYFSGDERYAAKAVELMRVWYLDEDTRMNPNLNFGQRVPGVCDGRGIGIIDTYRMIAVIEGLELLAGSSNLTKSDIDGLKDWFRQYRDWLLESDNGKNENTQPNNHGSSYDAQVALYSMFVGDPQPGFKHMQDTTFYRFDQIDADGCQPREMARTKSWGYCSSNLHYLAVLAKLGERFGLDYWNYVNCNGVTFRSAVEYYFPVVAGEKEWPGKNIMAGRGMDGLMSSIMMAAPHYDADEWYDRIDDILEYCGKEPSVLEKSLICLEYNIPGYSPASVTLAE